MEEEGEEEGQGWSRPCCLLETAGPVGEVEGVGPGGLWRRARGLEEEEGEAGGDDGVEVEGAGDLLLWEEVGEAGHPEFLVWMEEGEEELKLALWREEGEEGEEGLPGHLWREEEVVVELRCGVVEEEGGHHEKEVEGELEGGDERQDQVVSTHIKMTSYRCHLLKKKKKKHTYGGVTCTGCKLMCEQTTSQNYGTDGDTIS